MGSYSEKLVIKWGTGARKRVSPFEISRIKVDFFSFPRRSVLFESRITSLTTGSFWKGTSELKTKIQKSQLTSF